MMLLHVWLHFEYAEPLEALLAEHGVDRYVLHPIAAGRDREGRHDGSKVFPGHMALLEAQLEDEAVEPVLDSLRRFRDAKPSHAHLEALVLPVAGRL